MASVKYRDDRECWQVRWRELRVTVDAEGNESRKWVYRKRTVPSERAGLALARDIETKQAMGKAWEDGRESAVVTLGALSDAYITASGKGRPTATARFRASVLQKFVNWTGEDRPASDLTTGLLSDYADYLQTKGIKSVSRYVGLVEQLWKWGHNRGDTYPGIPAPRRITGADGDIPHTPAPVAVDTPTWGDVDAMIYALTEDGAPKGEGKGKGYRPQWELHRRVAIVQRYTGLRVSQILTLTWDDIDLTAGRLSIRAGRKGAKGQRRDRVVPMHPELVAVMATWGVRQGAIFTRTATKGARRGEQVTPRGSEVADVLTAAWERAGVDRAKWGDAGERSKARPTNAIRARWKSTMSGSASYSIAALMVGQSSGNGEHDSYVAMGNPEASPYWSTMTKALEAVPPMVDGPAPSNVASLEEARAAR